MEKCGLLYTMNFTKALPKALSHTLLFKNNVKETISLCWKKETQKVF